MCGIFGIVITPKSGFSRSQLTEYTKALFLLSESRGKEAAGIALKTEGALSVYKQAMPASEMVKTTTYEELFSNLTESKGILAQPVTLIGHSRLVTNGIEAIQTNNQPVVKSNHVGIHNGIIVNDALLWAKYPAMARQYQVDTEVLLALIGYFMDSGMTLENAYRKAFEEISGTASVAILADNSDDLVLATNNGSLYMVSDLNQGRMFFASERVILSKFMLRFFGADDEKQRLICPVLPNQAYRVNQKTVGMVRFSLKSTLAEPAENARSQTPIIISRIIDYSERDDPAHAHITRCTKCILPETMPFIEFDEHGICNYCHTYEPTKPLGKEALAEAVKPYRSKNGEPDCFVAVSGGRDSCYGLHVLCQEMGLRPISYTYDWGLVTDLARRNQARLCGKLGVEHILVSANIKLKREYVRKNVEAWLKRPRLGMIPLFMAGDKQYFYYAKKVKADNNLKVSFLCENKLERARFKSGFCGINEGKRRLFNLTLSEKATLLGYYAGQYLLNPAYINSSLLDTVSAFQSSYLDTA